GTLSAANGIVIAASTISGQVIVTGNAFATGHGIVVDSASSITATGFAHPGISVGSPTFTAGISNAGTISARNSAINVAARTLIGGINNSGLLTGASGI